MSIYNIYCDESCHLQRDNSGTMVLGAIWIESSKIKEITAAVKKIKSLHQIPEHAEIKWTGISPSKVQFYLDLVDYFFDDGSLHFRGVVATKNGLQHREYYQTHDDWYYKMLFILLKTILDPEQAYQIYIDIKDTRSSEKIKALKLYLNRAQYEFDSKIVTKVQTIRSHESTIMQFADLISGAIHFNGSPEQKSVAKCAVLKKIKDRSGKTLVKNTLYRESKLNLLIWNPRETEE